MLPFARESGSIPPQPGDFGTSRVFPIDAAPFFAQVFGLGERKMGDSQQPCPCVPIASLGALLGLSSQPRTYLRSTGSADGLLEQGAGILAMFPSAPKGAGRLVPFLKNFRALFPWVGSGFATCRRR